MASSHSGVSAGADRASSRSSGRPPAAIAWSRAPSDLRRRWPSAAAAVTRRSAGRPGAAATSCSSAGTPLASTAAVAAAPPPRHSTSSSWTARPASASCCCCCPWLCAAASAAVPCACLLPGVPWPLPLAARWISPTSGPTAPASHSASAPAALSPTAAASTWHALDASAVLLDSRKGPTCANTWRRHASRSAASAARASAAACPSVAGVHGGGCRASCGRGAPSSLDASTRCRMMSCRWTSASRARPPPCTHITCATQMAAARAAVSELEERSCMTQAAALHSTTSSHARAVA